MAGKNKHFTSLRIHAESIIIALIKTSKRKNHGYLVAAVLNPRAINKKRMNALSEKDITAMVNKKG